MNKLFKLKHIVYFIIATKDKFILRFFLDQCKVCSHCCLKEATCFSFNLIFDVFFLNFFFNIFLMKPKDYLWSITSSSALSFLKIIFRWVSWKSSHLHSSWQHFHVFIHLILLFCPQFFPSLLLVAAKYFYFKLLISPDFLKMHQACVGIDRNRSFDHLRPHVAHLLCLFWHRRESNINPPASPSFLPLHLQMNESLH